MKYIYALFLMSVFHTSCAQNKINLKEENLKSATSESTTLQVLNGVQDIKQDRDGNIWLASSAGIIRYDGKSFTNITSKVSSAPFFEVLEDRKGNFWFSAFGSGVYYYDGKSFQHFTTTEGLASNRVICIYEDKAGNIWFGTDGTGGGVSRYDGKTFRTFTTKEGLTNNDVHAIIQDKTGKLWFGTRGDVSVYDGKTFTTLTNKEGKAFKNVWCIIKDKKGDIWFGADGLWRYDGNSFFKVDQIGAGAITEDKDGNIWTTSGGAIFSYDKQLLSSEKPRVNEIKTKYEGLRNLPMGFLGANDGSIWFASGSGVSRYDGKTISDVNGKVSK